ncbi:hypothetical protein PG987_003362 [Apiospora arundinis]
MRHIAIVIVPLLHEHTTSRKLHDRGSGPSVFSWSGSGRDLPWSSSWLFGGRWCLWHVQRRTESLAKYASSPIHNNITSCILVDGAPTHFVTPSAQQYDLPNHVKYPKHNNNNDYNNALTSIDDCGYTRDDVHQAPHAQLFFPHKHHTECHGVHATTTCNAKASIQATTAETHKAGKAEPDLEHTFSQARSSASSQPPPTDRTSTMTNVTGFADLDTEAPEGAQIWRPPPSDPQSAATYYVADKWGNWVLSNRTRRSELVQVTEPAELDTYTPLTKSPIEKREEEAKAMAAALISEKRKSRRASRSGQKSMDRGSSYYSQSNTVAGRSLTTRPSGSVGTGAGTGTADSVSRKRMDRKGSKDSRGSATTIDTSYSGPLPLPPQAGHPSGTPKIHGRLDGATIRLVPPPKRPDFAASPPGQPSPTLGAVLPVRGSPSAYPPPLNPRRPWQQSGESGPSPITPTSGSGFSPKPQPQHFPTFPVPPLNINRPRSTPGGPRPDTKGQQQNPLARLDTRQPLRPQHISSFVSPISAAETTSSTTSSLLAKRLGNEKAAALSLDNGQNKLGGPWKRQRGGPNDPGLLSPEMAAAGMSTPRTRLPATPTWQPKLTPTRRGDDLFLNVQ